MFGLQLKEVRPGCLGVVEPEASAARVSSLSV